MRYATDEQIDKLYSLLNNKLGMSKAVIGKELGKSRQYIGDLFNKNKPMTLRMYLEICHQFDVNPDTLKVVSDKNTVTDITNVYNNSTKMAFYVSIPAQAGFAAGFGSETYLNQLPKMIVNETESGEYFIFEVRGDSMEAPTQDHEEKRRELLEGDKVLAKKLDQSLWGNIFTNRYIFVIAHKDEGLLIKKITSYDKSTGEINLRSFNPFYKDRVINIQDVQGLFYVKKLVERGF